eukprot:7123416-Prymnesium_polylepis.2
MRVFVARAWARAGAKVFMCRANVSEPLRKVSALLLHSHVASAAAATADISIRLVSRYLSTSFCCTASAKVDAASARILPVSFRSAPLLPAADAPISFIVGVSPIGSAAPPPVAISISAVIIFKLLSWPHAPGSSMLRRRTNLRRTKPSPLTSMGTIMSQSARALANAAPRCSAKADASAHAVSAPNVQAFPRPRQLPTHPFPSTSAGGAPPPMRHVFSKKAFDKNLTAHRSLRHPSHSAAALRKAHMLELELRLLVLTGRLGQHLDQRQCLLLLQARPEVGLIGVPIEHPPHVTRVKLAALGEHHHDGDALQHAVCALPLARVIRVETAKHGASRLHIELEPCRREHRFLSLRCRDVTGFEDEYEHREEHQHTRRLREEKKGAFERHVQLVAVRAAQDAPEELVRPVGVRALIVPERFHVVHLQLNDAHVAVTLEPQLQRDALLQDLEEPEHACAMGCHRARTEYVEDERGVTAVVAHRLLEHVHLRGGWVRGVTRWWL